MQKVELLKLQKIDIDNQRVMALIAKSAKTFANGCKEVFAKLQLAKKGV